MLRRDGTAAATVAAACVDVRLRPTSSFVTARELFSGERRRWPRTIGSDYNPLHPLMQEVACLAAQLYG